MLTGEQTKVFEQWYVDNAFDYEKAPLGSRDCALQRRAFVAGISYSIAKISGGTFAPPTPAPIAPAPQPVKDESK